MTDSEHDLAQLQVQAFRKRFGEPTYQLALHAAFPLALTPALLNHLWQTFDRDIYGHVLNVPWVATADLLLSDLCIPVANTVFELRAPVRRILLDALKSDPRFGERRIRELSEFVQEYVREQLDSANARTRAHAQAQQWTALATANPAQAAQEVAAAAKRSIESGNVGEQLRLAAVANTLAADLSAYQPLVEYLQTRRDVLQGKPRLGTLAVESPPLVEGIQLPALDTNLPTTITPSASPPPHIPPYIFGMVGLGGEQELLAAGRPGWVVIYLDVNRTNYTGDDFTRFEKQGIGVIVVLVNSFDGHGTIPAPAQYDEFTKRCAATVAQSTGARIWVIGQEPNAATARPNGKAIMPEEYARCFNRCRRAIRAVAGHASDWVTPAAIAPQNIETVYPGNPTGDWIRYFADVLTQIHAQGGGMDALALHVMGSAQTQDEPYQLTALTPPYEKNHAGFAAYRDYIAALPPRARNLPLLITEAWSAQAQRPGWENQNRGWIQAAFQEINAWNADANHQPIIALCLFQWVDPVWGISDKPNLIADLRAALKNEYRVRMPGAMPAPEPSIKQVETPVQTTAPPRDISEEGAFKPENSFALVIGISDVPELAHNPMASKEAYEIASALTDPALCGYRRENVRVLLDRQATRANILNAFQELSRQARQDTLVLIYFAGCAAMVVNRQEDFLIPADAQSLVDRNFAATWISVGELNDTLRHIPARVLLMLDTVSPVIAEKLATTLRPAAIGKEFAPTLSVIELARSGDGRPQHGQRASLASYLAQAFRGKVASQDGMIRVKDLAHFVRARFEVEQPQLAHFNAVTGPNFAVAFYRGGSAEIQTAEQKVPPTEAVGAPSGNYLDFDVKIARAPDGKGYVARIQSPVGEVEARFEIPFNDSELENFLLQLSATKRTKR